MAVRTLPMYDLEKAVGPRKPNIPSDVRLVQALLNALQGSNDRMLEGVPSITPHAIYSPSLSDAILTYQRNAKRLGGVRLAADGVMDPLPSRSGLAGDWDRDFRSGVPSTLVLVCYRLFRFGPEQYYKLGDTLNLPWAPNPFAT